jgi:PPOX class probable F420-dependent enzyme
MLPCMAELTPEIRALFEGANYAHVATLLPDGSPHSVAVWVGVEGDRVSFFTQSESRKARNLARDPRVAFSITNHDNPYETARVRGRVAETLTGDAALEVMDRISIRYTGEPFPMRGPNGVLFLVEVHTASRMVLPFSHEPG